MVQSSCSSYASNSIKVEKKMQQTIKKEDNRNEMQIYHRHFGSVQFCCCRTNLFGKNRCGIVCRDKDFCSTMIRVFFTCTQTVCKRKACILIHVMFNMVEFATCTVMILSYILIRFVVVFHFSFKILTLGNFTKYIFS